MEAITLIPTALARGAAAVADKTAGQAIKDGYNGLEQLIKRKLGNAPEKVTALEQHATAPEVWKDPLAHALGSSEVDRDAEILALAEKLLEEIDPAVAAAGTYNVSVTGGGRIEGFIQHASGDVTFNFTKSE